MIMTQGSDLFSVSRSSRALQDTRSSTLETQVAGPLRLVAGEVASWTSFILAQVKEELPTSEAARRARLSVMSSQGQEGAVVAWRALSEDVARSQETASFDLMQMSHRERREIPSWVPGGAKKKKRKPNQSCYHMPVRAGTSSHLGTDRRQDMKIGEGVFRFLYLFCFFCFVFFTDPWKDLWKCRVWITQAIHKHTQKRHFLQGNIFLSRTKDEIENSFSGDNFSFYNTESESWLKRKKRCLKKKKLELVSSGKCPQAKGFNSFRGAESVNLSTSILHSEWLIPRRQMNKCTAGCTVWLSAPGTAPVDLIASCGLRKNQMLPPKKKNFKNKSIALELNSITKTMNLSKSRAKVIVKQN